MVEQTGSVRTRGAMSEFWDARARENAMFFTHSVMDYSEPDEAAYWGSGEDTLARTLGPFGREIGRDDVVVEIGCGIGRITRPLAARARRVIGVDVSPEMVSRGRLALADLSNVELRVGNGRDLAGVADGIADVVYSFITFQHIPDPEVTCTYVREMGRVLRPGGWAVFQVSEQPAVHRADSHPGDRGVRATVDRARGRRPQGTLAPEWLGSAVPRERLLAALADGGLELVGTVGDDTLYCMVHAVRPA